ncbi:Glutamate--cysteine ligase catalytic subunit [Cucumispora dikerogammari]|nr:Glutamate--cysteine ligase catalytic subunit [Cucumispora dikerogammari]
MTILKKTTCIPIPTKLLEQYESRLKQSALDQFIKIYKNHPNSRFKFHTSTYMLWGYEIELMIVGEENKDYKLILGAPAVIEKYEKSLKSDKPLEYILHREYGQYMLEFMTKEPFSLTNKGGFNTENCQKITCGVLSKLDNLLKEIDAFSLIMTSFPLIGYDNNRFTFINMNNESIGHRMIKSKENVKSSVVDYKSGNMLENDDIIVKSKNFPFSAISSHPRFPYLTKATVNNRGGYMNSSVYIKNSVVEQQEVLKIDHMGQGFGNSCLQVTISINDVFEKTCALYDHLIPLAPLMLYLSRATAIMSGKEIVSCHRWEQISACVDDRQQNLLKACDKLCLLPKVCERKYNAHSDDKIIKHNGSKNIDKKNDKKDNNCNQKMPKKSRASSVDFYLNINDLLNDQEYNDTDAVINVDTYFYLLEYGIPKGVARIIANEFAYKPLLIYEDQINNIKYIKSQISETNVNINNIDVNYHRKTFTKNSKLLAQGIMSEIIKDEKEVEDFLSLQSICWRSLRLKIPIDGIWKVEFRTLETQFTAFENCSFATFLVIFSQTILNHDNIKYKQNADFDFKIPISLVDINFVLSNVECFDYDSDLRGGLELLDIINHKRINENGVFRKEGEEYYYKDYKIVDFPTRISYSPQKFFFKLNKCFYNKKKSIGFATLEDIFSNILVEMKQLAKTIGPKTLERIDFMSKKIKGEYKSNSQVIRRLFNDGLKTNNQNVIKANNYLIQKIKQIQINDDPLCKHLK